MLSQKSFSCWERNWAKDDNFLCDIGWRKVNQSTPLLPIQQEKDDYQKAEQTKLYQVITQLPHKDTSLLVSFISRRLSCVTCSTRTFRFYISVELLRGFFDSFFCFLCVSCFVDWLSKSFLCPFLAQGTALEEKPCNK